MGRIELRTFDGDLEALAAMARDPWLEECGEHSFPDLYRPALAGLFFADVPDPRFLVAAYDGARLVAFIANLPRTYRLNGKTYQAVYSCMMVGRKGYQGAVVYLIAESLRRNEDFGADLALMTLEKPLHSWRMFEKYMKPQHRIVTLKTMIPLLHAVDFAKIVESENLKPHEVAAIKLYGAHRRLLPPPVAGVVRPYRDTDLAPILALTRRYSDQGSLVRDFDQASLARHLHTEDVTATVVYERDGAVAGFVNLSMRDMVNHRGSQRWAWLDFLYWEGLDRQEKQALLAGAWEASKEQNCIGLLEWNKDYYAKGSLFRARFIPYPRFLEVDAWILNPALSLRRIDSIFEQVI
jgi:hypothetical protein